MAKAKTITSDPPKKIRRAIDPEAREKQMINLAINLAERQLMDGTASSQVITHFLKLGTTMAELEREKLRIDNRKTEAQIKSIESGEESKLRYEQAIKAMRNYAGYGDPDEYEY